MLPPIATSVDIKAYSTTETMRKRPAEIGGHKRELRHRCFASRTFPAQYKWRNTFPFMSEYASINQAYCNLLKMRNGSKYLGPGALQRLPLIKTLPSRKHISLFADNLADAA